MANVCLLTMVVIYMLCWDTRQPNKNGEYTVSYSHWSEETLVGQKSIFRWKPKCGL